MRHRWPVAVLITVAACSSNDSPPPVTTDGASSDGASSALDANTIDDGDASTDGGRTVVPALVPSDGTRLAIVHAHWATNNDLPVGLFDKTLSVGCSFLNASDNVIRCLPNADMFLPSSFFGDMGCTVPVAVTSSPATTIAPYYLQLLNQCPSATRVLSLKAHTGAIFSNDTGTCHMVAAPAIGSIFDPVEVAPATFVRGKRMLMPSGETRVSAVMVQGDDGSVFPSGWHDATANTDCVSRRLGDGSYRCVPGPLGGVDPSRFTDTACTKPLATSVVACPQINFALTSINACPTYVNVSYGGPPAVAMSTGSAAACAPIPAGAAAAGLPTYATGAPAAPTLFASMTAPLWGEGRLRVRGEAIGGLAQTTGFQDTMFGTCVSAKAKDGAQRCFPTSSTAPLVALFTDDVCGKAATIAIVPAQACVPVGITVIDDSGVSRLFKVGAEQTALFQNNSGTCKPFQNASGVDNKWYLVGAEIPPDQLIALTYSHD